MWEEEDESGAEETDRGLRWENGGEKSVANLTLKFQQFLIFNLFKIELLCTS